MSPVSFVIEPDSTADSHSYLIPNTTGKRMKNGRKFGKKQWGKYYLI